MDNNPRPQKRLRIDHQPDLTLSAEHYSLESTPSSSSILTTSSLRLLPPQLLLLALPALLAHPPTHVKYGLSLFLSVKALRQCLRLPALSPDVECHAWFAFAEVGLRAIESGFSTSGEHDWANGLEEEVEKAIGKGLLISQKNPSLRPLRHNLLLLNAHFSFRNDNTRFARAVLRRLISSFVSSDPPTIVYTAHLALITQLSTTSPSPSHRKPPDTYPYSQSTSTSAPEFQAALIALTNLSALAAQNQHFEMLKLAAVLRVRILIAAEMWHRVGEAIDNAERLLDLVFENEGDVEGIQDRGHVKQEASELLARSYSITAQDVHDSAASQSQSQAPSLTPGTSDASNYCFSGGHSAKPPDTDPLGLALKVHTLMLGILYHTHSGRAQAAGPRLASLHSMMDSGALVGGVNSDGIVEIPIPPYPPITLRITHPRVMFLLTFLISAVAKRDPVGRRPKKKVFAESGVAQCREGRNEGDIDINVPLWASLRDVEDIDQRTLKIEADLLCELAAVSIQRYDFDAAENYLATVIAHARTHGFFEEYASRVTLHYAHLAHALGDTVRAETCYRVAANLDGAGPVGSSRSPTSGFVAAAARAGEALLRIGLVATRAGSNCDPDPDGPSYIDASTVALAKDAIARCSSNTSAPLPALSELLSAALASSQIIRSKSLLKHALALSGGAGDNHLRALVLAFVGAQYVYTAPEHAMEVLAVCETLGAGMGAVAKKTTSNGGNVETSGGESGDGIGNAPLRLWVGERFLELFNRAGKEKRVRKQEEFNALYRSAVDKARDRRSW
ncbi:hypothetical protein V8B97DRAFT_1872534 [Scleroderma yunnanense]